MEYYCCLVAKSCLALCDTWTAACQASLSFTVSQNLLRSMSIKSMILSNRLILCCPLLLLPSIFPSIRVFSYEFALCFRWPRIRASPSVSVLPMNIQGIFPLGFAVLVSLMSKGFSRVFSKFTFQKHQFFHIQPSLVFNSHIRT